MKIKNPYKLIKYCLVGISIHTLFFLFYLMIGMFFSEAIYDLSEITVFTIYSLVVGSISGALWSFADTVSELKKYIFKGIVIGCLINSILIIILYILISFALCISDPDPECNFLGRASAGLLIVFGTPFFMIFGSIFGAIKYTKDK